VNTTTSTAAIIAVAFAALYASHTVADHLVQTDWQAQGKTADKGWLWPMAGHLAGYLITQYAFLYAIALAGVPFGLWGFLGGLAFSVATHGVIDRRWPVRWLLEHTGSAPFARLADGGINGIYLADQALHVGCLFVAALIIGGLS
jgi:hypothetical protein